MVSKLTYYEKSKYNFLPYLLQLYITPCSKTVTFILPSKLSSKDGMVKNDLCLYGQGIYATSHLITQNAMLSSCH